MMGGPTNTHRLSPSQAANLGLSRRWRLTAVLIVLALGLGGGTWWLSDQAKGAALLQTNQKTVQSLADLSAGTGAELVLEGQSAQERNALIPLSGRLAGKVAGFSISGADRQNIRTAQKCMTQAIYYEAANEPIKGKRAVAQVVLNRMRHPAYPSSVCGVVYDGANKPVCQFSFTCDGSLLRKPMALQWQVSAETAKAALAGSTEPSVGTATHYHADYVLPRWAYRLGKIDQIGHHIFYRFKGNWGQVSAFDRAWSGKEFIPALDMVRLRNALNSAPGAGGEMALEDVNVPGLTVPEHITDRHAPADVGGRIDTTKQWRLSIPDPVSASSTYRDTLNHQGDFVGKDAVMVADAALSGKANP